MKSKNKEKKYLKSEVSFDDIIISVSGNPKPKPGVKKQKPKDKKDKEALPI